MPMPKVPDIHTITKPLNGHTRWVVAVVSTALVTLLGTLLYFDHEHVVGTAHEANTRSIRNEQRVTVMEQRTQVELKQIREDIAEIKEILLRQQRKDEDR